MSPVSSASGMNSTGRISAALRMTPAHQRLEAGDLAALDVDERLIEQLELAVLDRLAQIELDDAAGLHARVHFGFEEAVDAAAVGLGPIKRHVGVLESCPASSPSSGAMAMPTLTPTIT